MDTHIRRIIPAFSIIGTLLFLSACKEKPQPITGRQYTGVFMNTPYTIDVVGDSTNYQSAIDSILGLISAQFDMNSVNSTLYKYNTFHRTDTAFAFRDDSKVFGIIYELAKEFNRRSLQFYDPTMMPLKRAWVPFKVSGLGGEPNLDSLYKFVGFDGAKTDLNEITEENGYVYKESQMRKADPRIELDLNNLAIAYGLDMLEDYLTSKNVPQFKIQHGNRWITRGVSVDELNILSLGISGDSTDQKFRLLNRAFAFKSVNDKMTMVDPTYGYPVENEIVYVGVSAPTLAEAEIFSEVFMIMGFDQAAAWYTDNEDSDIQSFMVLKRGEEISTASTEEFDITLISPDSLSTPSE